MLQQDRTQQPYLFGIQRLEQLPAVDRSVGKEGRCHCIATDALVQRRRRVVGAAEQVGQIGFKHVRLRSHRFQLGQHVGIHHRVHLLQYRRCAFAQLRFLLVHGLHSGKRDTPQRLHGAGDGLPQGLRRVLALALKGGLVGLHGLGEGRNLADGAGGGQALEVGRLLAQPQDRVGEIAIVANPAHRIGQLVVHHVQRLGLVRQHQAALLVERTVGRNGGDGVRLACAGRPFDHHDPPLRLAHGQQDLALLFVQRDGRIEHHALHQRQRVPSRFHPFPDRLGVAHQHAFHHAVEQIHQLRPAIAGLVDDLLEIIQQRLVGALERSQVQGRRQRHGGGRGLAGG
ncbi:hypothetical protein D3C71_893420 [compost metagenome]